VAKLGGVLFIVALIVTLGATFVRSYYDSYKQVDRCGDTTYGPSARFVRDEIPAGKQVMTCDWDDAPYVFYYSHKHYYTVFLDPNFMYVWRPDVWHRWDQLTHARDKDPLHTLRNFFSADYVYCTGDFGAFRSQLSRQSGAEQIYPPRQVRDQYDLCRRQGDCLVCSQTSDCPKGSICKHPGAPDKPKQDKPKRCEPDPHVFIFRVR
jgi:hypothetical protein